MTRFATSKPSDNHSLYRRLPLCPFLQMKMNGQMTLPNSLSMEFVWNMIRVWDLVSHFKPKVTKLNSFAPITTRTTHYLLLISLHPLCHVDHNSSREEDISDIPIHQHERFKLPWLNLNWKCGPLIIFKFLPFYWLDSSFHWSSSYPALLSHAAPPAPLWRHSKEDSSERA